MALPEHRTIKAVLDEHAHTVDALHEHINSLAGDAATHETLVRAVEKHKAATKEFSDDVLGFVGNH